MKKYLTIMVAAFLAVAIAMPAFAAVEFKYGGQFRWRLESEDNVFDGTTNPDVFNNNGVPGTNNFNGDDNRNFIDQRLRLYFSFIASKNLKVVTKFEMGDTTWGFSGNRLGAGSGGNVGADAVSVEVKNAYVEFNIPQTPTTAIIGIQTITLLDSWIVDDDFSAAVFVTKLDPFRITLGYVAGQNGASSRLDNAGNVVANDANVMPFTDPAVSIDSIAAAVDYAEGPWKASVVFFYQNGHDTLASADPRTLTTPVTGQFNKGLLLATPGAPAGVVSLQTDPFFSDPLILNNFVTGNELFDIGFNVTYKIDWLSAYVNFVKNFGSIDFERGTVLNAQGLPSGPSSFDYTGWMIDAGLTYYCGPYTFNVGGFYTTGPDNISDVNSHTNIQNLSGDIDWFTYPLATAKYFSEIIGGGVLGDDRYAYRGFGQGVSAANMGTANGLTGLYWRGYGFPTNLWTLTAGASWQVAEKTKISGSYWYFGTSEDVPVAVHQTALGPRFDMSGGIGHEFNLYVDQGITDGLTLTLVGAYLLADDAFAPVPSNLNAAQAFAQPVFRSNQADDAYELGARLQWNF